MLVLLNGAAGGGRALSRWRSVGPWLREQVGPFELQDGSDARATEARIVQALRSGERRFVAAGGDGTVNLVINLLASLAPPELLAQLAIGAVGLGSSNDFHKPFQNRTNGTSIPSRVNFDAAIPYDLGLLWYLDQDGVARRRFWVNNASIGVTADGNHRFNSPDALLRWLKRVSPGRGIGYAALRAVLGHRPRNLTLWVDDGPPLTLSVSNLGVVKNPHFAGSLRYDSPFEPDSGCFHVHLLEGAGPGRLLPALWSLAHGRFTGRPGTRSWRAARLMVAGPIPFPVEVDGEVVLAHRAHFGMLRRHLRLCP